MVLQVGSCWAAAKLLLLQAPVLQPQQALHQQRPQATDVLQLCRLQVLLHWLAAADVVLQQPLPAELLRHVLLSQLCGCWQLQFG